MAVKKISIVTGSRAEFGLLTWVIRELQKNSQSFETEIYATGTHFAKAFGETYLEIEKQGFKIDAKVELPLEVDNPTGIANSLGKATSEFAKVYEKQKPDLIVVLGDRYEILGATMAALITGVPVAHFAGGDITEGAFDESIRHCITKIASIHFTTCEDSKRRVIQMGENPKFVLNVGSLSLDSLRNLKLLGKSEIEQSLECQLGAKNILVTFHPETKSPQILENLEIALKALDQVSAQADLFITGANADTFGQTYNEKFIEFAARKKGRYFFNSLGQARYLSLMSLCDVVWGNSSSGIYEAPALKKWTVNIGDRQKGRIFAPSIKCTPLSVDKIVSVTDEALSSTPAPFNNPFGNGEAAKKAVDFLLSVSDFKDLSKKTFFDLNK